MPPGSRQARKPAPPRESSEIQKSRPLAGAPQPGPARARALLPLVRVARHHRGVGPWGDGPASSGAKRRVNLGGGGSSWAGCVCRGSGNVRAMRLSARPTPAKSQVEGGRRVSLGTSGDDREDALPEISSGHADMAATRHDEPRRRGDRSPSASTDAGLLPHPPTGFATPFAPQAFPTNFLDRDFVLEEQLRWAALPQLRHLNAKPFTFALRK